MPTDRLVGGVGHDDLLHRLGRFLGRVREHHEALGGLAIERPGTSDEATMSLLPFHDHLLVAGALLRLARQGPCERLRALRGSVLACHKPRRGPSPGCPRAQALGPGPRWPWLEGISLTPGSVVEFVEYRLPSGADHRRGPIGLSFDGPCEVNDRPLPLYREPVDHLLAPTMLGYGQRLGSVQAMPLGHLSPELPGQQKSLVRGTYVGPVTRQVCDREIRRAGHAANLVARFRGFRGVTERRLRDALPLEEGSLDFPRSWPPQSDGRRSVQPSQAPRQPQGLHRSGARVRPAPRSVTRTMQAAAPSVS